MSRWIRNLKFSTKLLVIMIAGLVPLALLTGLYLNQAQQRIRGLQQELAGLSREQNLQAMLLPVGAHETGMIAAASGEPATEQLQRSSDELQSLMAQQEQIDQRLGGSDGDERRWSELKATWRALASTPAGSVADAMRMHEQLRQRILEYLHYIAVSSGLMFDEDPVRHFVVDATVVQIPEYEEYIAQLRSQAASVAATGKASTADIETLARHRVLAQRALERLVADIGDGAAFAGAPPPDTAGQPRPEELLSPVKAAFDGFSRYVQERLTGGAQSDPLDAVLQNASPLLNSIATFHDTMQPVLEQQLQHSEAQLRATRDRMALLVLLMVVLGMGFMGVVILSTVRGMNEAVATVSRVSEGDYTQTIVAHGRDELARMMRALQAMQEKLRGVLSGVKDSAITVATGARQINAGTTDLSARTEQQAANLEETASSMEEMTATVKQNADNAKLANKLAQAARDQAEHGGAIVEQTVAAMAAIDVSSNKIADIISVIDEIAFQTNLLALNAAVEAARAGDQGRGFAVVASEVRSLAQRSASAAKEIKGLIQDSVGKVAEGSRLVSESGRHLNEIVASVKKVSDVVGEISNASQEQAASVEEISRAVLQMDESTQQNAAMVEEASAAAGSMNDQASRLSELTAFFRLPETPGSAPPASPSAHTDVRAGAQREIVPLRRRSAARRAVQGAAAAAPLAPGHEPLGAVSGADWDEF